MWVWVPCVMRSLDASLVWMWTSAYGCVLIRLECGCSVCAIRKYEWEAKHSSSIGTRRYMYDSKNFSMLILVSHDAKLSVRQRG